MKSRRKKIRFAENLHTLMKEQGVTQEFLAQIMGITQAAVSNYLGGRIPSSDKLFGIANYFGITIDELLQENLSERSGPASGPIRKRLAYDALVDRMEALSDDECERFARMFLKLLGELKPAGRK